MRGEEREREGHEPANVTPSRARVMTSAGRFCESSPFYSTCARNLMNEVRVRSHSVLRFVSVSSRWLLSALRGWRRKIENYRFFHPASGRTHIGTSCLALRSNGTNPRTNVWVFQNGAEKQNRKSMARETYFLPSG